MGCTIDLTFKHCISYATICMLVWFMSSYNFLDNQRY